MKDELEKVPWQSFVLGVIVFPIIWFSSCHTFQEPMYFFCSSPLIYMGFCHLQAIRS